ncbi:MAG: HAMP domain-containing sensor histidine kinase [bacterium]|nr:HAMP domain-containing sensor histidine kinase [bacterium]
MIYKIILIVLVVALGGIISFVPEIYNNLSPELIGGIFFIIALFILIDLWETKYGKGNFPKIDAHTESLAFTAHQLRSPLTVIKGYADLIVDGTFGETTDGIKDAGIKIKISTDRAFKIIDELLDYNSLEVGRMTCKPETVALNSFLKENLKKFDSLALEKKLILSFIHSSEEINIIIDPSHLEHIVENIISNSIKYTEKGKIEVFTKLDLNEKFAIIEVTDTGKGIPLEILSTIFLPFERDPRHARDTKGMGLGLAIAKKLSELNGCMVWAKSEGIGKGAVFYLKIPLKII